jgi:Leucine Rich repeat/Leucine Rich Repeat
MGDNNNNNNNNNNNYNSEGDFITARDEIRLHRRQCHLTFPLMEGILKALFNKIREHVIFATSASTATSASRAPNKTIYDTIIKKLADEIIGRDSAGKLNDSYQIKVDYVLGLEVVPKNNIEDLRFINQFFSPSPESTSSSSSAAASSSSTERDTADRAKQRRAYFRRKLNSIVLATQFDEFATYLKKIRNKKARLREQVKSTGITKVKNLAKVEETYKKAEVADVRFNFLLNRKQDLFLIEIIDKLGSSSEDRLGVHLTIGVNSAYTNNSGIDKTLTYHITDVETGDSRHRFYKAMNNSFTGESIKKDLSSSAARPVSSSAAGPVSSSAAPVSSSVAGPVSSSAASATFTYRDPLVLKKDETLSDLFKRFPSALHIDISEKIYISDAEFAAAIDLGLKNVLSLNMTSCHNIQNNSLARLTNLTSLNMFLCIQISNAGLAPLTKLTSLNMVSCTEITDAGLAPLTNLTSLNMIECGQITDAGLAPLTKLTSLNMNSCRRITDAGLAPLTNLTSLDMTDNRQITATGLARLTKLTGLNMTGCRQITDAGLARLTNLTSLNMYDCQQITDAGLAPLTNLTSLNMARCVYITDAGLAPLTNLTSLNIGYCYNISRNVFKNLNRLERISAEECNPGVKEAAEAKIASNRARNQALSATVPSSSSASAAVLEGPTTANVRFCNQLLVAKKGETLSKILMRFPGALCIELSLRTDITNIEFVSAMDYGLTNIEGLYMTGCLNIKNESLALLTKLKVLSIRDCYQITDAGLEPLTNLTILNMGNCSRITDTGLARLTNLTELYINYCRQITDASLASLTKLTRLDMYGCTGIKDAGLARLTNLTRLNIEFCPQITPAAFKNLNRLQLCYADFCAPGVKEAAEAKIRENRTRLAGGTRRRRFKKTKKSKKTKTTKKTKKTKKTRRN